MALTEQQIEILLRSPLDDTLDDVRGNLGDDASHPQATNIASILLALVGSAAAFHLPCPDGRGNVASRLLAIRQHVRDGTVRLDHFRPLVCHVIDESPDTKVWEAVFNIIDTLGVLTPPPSSIPPTFRRTPIRTSSSQLADSETRDIIEGELFEEIKNCTFRNVGGFWDKFFDPQSWVGAQKAMLSGILTEHDGKRWTGFPATPDEKPVWDWLRSLEEHFLASAPHKLYTTTAPNQFNERKGQMHIFLQKPGPPAGGTFWYKDVLVVGEQKKSYDTSRFKGDFLQLTRHVRSVFADQPARRLVHAFSVCASTMELWVYDRSGSYSSGPFDIHLEPDKFARALVGYTTMDDHTMGLDTFIERQDKHRYITLDDTGGHETRVKLDRAMVRQKGIVCRGTTCYETADRYVAKFSWASDKRTSEVEQLKLAEAKGVQGVARVVAHRRITTIAEMREGLQFPSAHRFRGEDLPSGDMLLRAISNSSGRKRNLSSGAIPDQTSQPKRRRFDSSRSKLGAEFDDQPSNAAKPSLYTPGEDLWENRIFSCLVISPAGRIVSEFRTIKELLESLRDAIKAHRSLYVVGNILHRDISSSNIIITDPGMADGFRGMLIDLDLAKIRDSGPSGARQQTGTMQFMAIEVLRKTDHTYRHDLESFFYVLVWMCARQSWRNGFAGAEKPPRESLLRKWEIGSFGDIARIKAGDMTMVGLEDIMGEFPESLAIVKPLCERMRKILFSENDGRISFGTPAGDPDQLYQPIIASFDQTLSELRKITLLYRDK